MTGYTKTKTFTTGETILADHFTTEFNNISVAFDESTGHNHNGDVDSGAFVPLISSADTFTKITATVGTDQLNFYTNVSGAAALQLSFKDGVIEPNADSDVDIGTTAKRFKDLYVDSATVTADINVNGQVLLSDSSTLKFGTDGTNYFEIYKATGVDGGSFIKEVGGGAITLQGQNGYLRSDTKAVASWGSLDIALKYDDANRIVTTATGVTVTGDVAATTVTTTGAITGGSFVIGSADISEAELETIDGVTAGTVAASKAVVVDAALDITGFRNITLTGELDAATLDVSGNIAVDGTVDGRDIAADGILLDAIEAGADVTDTENVVAALTAGTNITIAANGTITATDTNTTYSVQDGELSENNFTNDDHTKLNNIEASADITDTTNVVAALTAGTNIAIAANGTITATDTNDVYTGGTNVTINGSNVISSTDTNTEYTGGTGLTLSAGNEFSVDAAQTSITSVGALSGGSIASGFGAIDNGASAITTTGTVTTGSLVLNSSTALTSIDDTLATSKAIKTYVDTVTADASAGDITSVVAGDGLTGGATSGDATVNVVGGVGIVANDDEVVLDLSELTTSTADADGDFFAVVDASNLQKKLTKANIALSGMNNDSGWTSNAGTVTSVGAGTGLTTTGGTTPSLSVNAAQSGITSLGTLSALNVTGDLTLEALYPTGTGNLFLGTISGGSAVAASSQYNTGVGNAALGAVTTATFNTAVGGAALQSLTTGTNNVAFGLNAGKSSVNASTNSSFGVSALYSLVNGSSNTALGTYAGYSLTTASSNVLVGVSAGYDLTTGFSNIVLGTNAARKAVTVTNSVVIGQDAGYNLTDQGGIIAIGHDAMKGSAVAGAFTGGEACIAIGENALESIATAQKCTVIGDQAGMDITTGWGNTLVGFSAGTNITTGGFNVAIGDGTGQSITTASNITALGYFTGRYLGSNSVAVGSLTGHYQKGTNNTFLGSGAGQGSSAYTGTAHGVNNTAIGTNAHIALTTASYSVAVGYESLENGTGGSFNTAIGSSSLNNLTTGVGNTAIGYQAAEATATTTSDSVSVGRSAGLVTGNGSVNVGALTGYNQSGQYNVFIGRQAGYGVLAYRLSDATPAKENTGVGYASLKNLTGGEFNTAIGRTAGYYLSTGDSNTLLGKSSGYNLTTGSNNVLVGSLAGQNITTGSNNIVIGTGSGSGLSNANNVTIIGSFTGTSPDLDAVAYAGSVVISSNDSSSPDPLLLLEKNGNINIPSNNGLWSASNGGFRFENVAGTKILKWARGSTPATNAYAQLFYNSGGSIIGSINTTSTGISISYTSDYRLKENVSPLTGSIDRLKALKPCTFNFLSEPTRQEEGFIAHEVQEVVPQAVVGVKDAVDENGDAELQGVDPSRIVVILTGALQEAIEKIEQLEERISALEA